MSENNHTEKKPNINKNSQMKETTDQLERKKKIEFILEKKMNDLNMKEIDLENMKFLLEKIEEEEETTQKIQNSFMQCEYDYPRISEKMKRGEQLIRKLMKKKAKEGEHQTSQTNPETNPKDQN